MQTETIFQPAAIVFADPKRRGRPKGSKTTSVEVPVNATRCPKCGSSGRSKYFGTVRTLETSGLTEDGSEYNRITYRRCKCDCGQVRIEKTYELIYRVN